MCAGIPNSIPTSDVEGGPLPLSRSYEIRVSCVDPFSLPVRATHRTLRPQVFHRAGEETRVQIEAHGVNVSALCRAKDVSPRP